MLSAGVQDSARLSPQRHSNFQLACESALQLLTTWSYRDSLLSFPCWFCGSVKFLQKHNIYITQVLIDSRMSHSTLLCAASEVGLMHCILPLIHIGRAFRGWRWKKNGKKKTKNLFAPWPFCPLF